MSILNNFLSRRPPQNTAKIAKDRLRFAIELQRNGCNNQEGLLEKMKEEILGVVENYFDIGPDDIEAGIIKAGNIDVFELNINLPDKPKGHNSSRGDY